MDEDEIRQYEVDNLTRRMGGDDGYNQARMRVFWPSVICTMIGLPFFGLVPFVDGQSSTVWKLFMIFASTLVVAPLVHWVLTRAYVAFNK